MSATILTRGVIVKKMLITAGLVIAAGSSLYGADGPRERFIYEFTTTASATVRCGQPAASVHVYGTFTTPILEQYLFAGAFLNGPVCYTDDLSGAPHDGTCQGSSTRTQIATYSIEIIGGNDWLPPVITYRDILTNVPCDHEK
jgi:hypothetical protein